MFRANTFESNKACVWTATGELVCQQPQKQQIKSIESFATEANKCTPFTCSNDTCDCKCGKQFRDASANVKTPSGSDYCFANKIFGNQTVCIVDSGLSNADKNYCKNMDTTLRKEYKQCVNACQNP